MNDCYVMKEIAINTSGNTVKVSLRKWEQFLKYVYNVFQYDFFDWLLFI